MNTIKNPHISIPKEKVWYFRFKASVLVFVIINFLFFLNYFFIWAKFYFEITIKLFPYLYILLLVSFLFFIFYALKYKITKLKSYNSIIIFVLLFLVLFLFSVFIIFGSDILTYIN